MSRTIFFNIPATGHINPTLGVLRELRARGEEVLVVNTERMRSQYAGLDVRFAAYPIDEERLTLFGVTQGGSVIDNALALVHLSEQIMPFMLDLLEREQPDYVIYDSLCGWARQAVVKRGLPAAASITTLVLLPDTLPPLPPSLLLHTLGALLLRMPSYARVAWRMRRRFGVKGIGIMGAVMNTAALNIVFTSSEIQMGSAQLATKGFRFVGPSFAERPAETDFPFDQLTRKPLIYISLGTINNQNHDFYRMCFEAFADYPAQFILSAGQRTDLKALGTPPANFLVRNFVPQLDVLQRVEVFITHGGMNSVHEGLYYSVPLVVVPQQIEQSVVARRVVELGAGVALGDTPPYGRTSAAALRHALEQVMAAPEAYRTAAARLGKGLREAGGAARAAEELIAFGQSQKGKR
jgi:MGT family glycosyltransferase